MIAVNERKVKNSADMRNRVGLLRIGDKLNMRIIRDGKAQELVAIIAEPELTSISGEKLSPKLAGALLAQIESKNNPSQTHVMVAEIVQGSPAWYAHLRKGDIILSINRHAVDSLLSLQQLVVNQRQILLSIQRGDRAMFVLMK